MVPSWIIFFIFMLFSKAYCFTTTNRLYSSTPNLIQRRTRSQHSLLYAQTPSLEDEDLKKWEEMYVSGDTTTLEDSSFLSAKSEVRVATFDLDNTIWRTNNVISTANDALALHLKSMNINAPVRVEKIMGELFKANKAKYCPLAVQDMVESDDASLEHVKAPTLLTDLRIDAIKEVLRNQTIPFDQDESVDMDEIAKEFFEVWAHARHTAIPENFASSVIECLQELRQLKTRNGKPIVVGAITDGNSDPRRVKELEGFFDFVINAESVGVSKPDRRIYEIAVNHVGDNEEWKHVFGTDIHKEMDLTDMLGPWWVHIGDDFVKDIVAAKELNMRSLWCRELIKKSQDTSNENTNEKRRRTVQDLAKDIAENGVLQMTIGSDDFLADSITNEFADAVTDSFSEVAIIVRRWHEEGLSC
jgi:FMN phosphatase YigB (HAD superfamily)